MFSATMDAWGTSQTQAQGMGPPGGTHQHSHTTQQVTGYAATLWHPPAHSPTMTLAVHTTPHGTGHPGTHQHTAPPSNKTRGKLPPPSATHQHGQDLGVIPGPTPTHRPVYRSPAIHVACIDVDARRAQQQLYGGDVLPAHGVHEGGPLAPVSTVHVPALRKPSHADGGKIESTSTKHAGYLWHNEVSQPHLTGTESGGEEGGGGVRRVQSVSLCAEPPRVHPLPHTAHEPEPGTASTRPPARSVPP